jgi:hypothetical protein
MFFGTALIDDEQKIIVANKTKNKFFTMDYLADELDFEPYSELLEFIWENDEEY